ncbi:CAF17-like 4Fe-4S cluster assembly/insertion protein YgfZ [Paractinoplanes durhamensis]|uniref:Glycine cleavage system protein T n=1 Tax=Paractinoplanes durhamensis TaxID=113563 RepID=A0ABQ3YQ60_9ACTN|nr:folate-binding protein YgfZ [Actinoplanes durhamensis]GID99714.1 glycine cleavage system protein T [Actinoplanes durhamensis]
MTTIMVEDLDPTAADAGVPAHYGDPMREQRTLATAVGLVDRSNRDVLAVPGEERASWLHTLTTQHLSDLSANTGSELLVLSPNGHVEQHAFVTEDGTTAWLDTEPGAGAGLLKYLEMMRFFTRVEPRDATAELAVLSLVGPAAADLFPDLAAPRLSAVPGAKFAAGEVPPHATSIYDVRAYEGGLARRVPLGVDLLVPRSAKAAVIEKLGVPLAGLWAYEAIRVEHRVPRLGWETDHRTIPAEAEFTAPAVHLDKGCYRGQETVARVHHLGRPPRRLALLHLDGIASDQPPVQGTPVTLGDRQVGFVGTAVRHHELGLITLAVLKRNVADDAELRIGDSVAAIDPPLDPA